MTATNITKYGACSSISDEPNIGTEAQSYVATPTLPGLPSELHAKIFACNPYANMSLTNKALNQIVKDQRTDILQKVVGKRFNQIMRGEHGDKIYDQLIKYVNEKKSLLTQEEWAREGITPDDLNDLTFNKIDVIYKLIKDKIFINFFCKLRDSFVDDPTHAIHQLNMDAASCRAWLSQRYGANRLNIGENFLSTFYEQHDDRPPEILTQELETRSVSHLITYACEVGDLELLDVCIRDYKYAKISHGEWYGLKRIAQQNGNHLIVEKLKLHEPELGYQFPLFAVSLGCVIAIILGATAGGGMGALLILAPVALLVTWIAFFNCNYDLNMLDTMLSKINNALNTVRSCFS